MRKIYIFITFIYSFLSTFYETIILKNSTKNKDSLEIGFCRINNLKYFELNQ